MPGALTPTRSRADRHDIAEAQSDEQLIDPQDEVDSARYPTVHRLTSGLAEDHFNDEFEAGLQRMLDQVEDSLT